MTHLSKVILSLFFLLGSFPSCGQQYLDIHTNSFNRGVYCYILWTSDTTLSNPHPGNRLTLDKNNVVYVHRNLQPGKSKIRIISEEGKDFSDNMINIMSDVENNYLDFYIPTAEEIKKHPHWDQYYQNKFFNANKRLHKPTIPDL